jgi:purine-binding chemotaxis protein CheW
MTASEEKLKSELLLEELKRRGRQKDVVDVEEERVKVMIFACGTGRYAFYGSSVREVLPSCEICWVPGLPDYLPGLINVRGDIESVIDLAHFLGEKRDQPFSGLIAMAVQGEFRSGVMIDAIEDVVDVPVSALGPPLTTLEGAARELVTGTLTLGAGTVSLVDVGRLPAKVTL